MKIEKHDWFDQGDGTFKCLQCDALRYCRSKVGDKKHQVYVVKGKKQYSCPVCFEGIMKRVMKKNYVQLKCF